MANFSNIQNISRSIIIMGFRIEFYANKHIYEPLGLTASSFKIMAILYNHPDVSPVEILNKLGCTKSNITQRLNFLEKQKLITRIHDKNNLDKRKKIITLTKLGKEKYVKVAKILKRYSLSFEKHFTKEEIRSQISFLKKLHKILNNQEKFNSLSKIL